MAKTRSSSAISASAHQLLCNALRIQPSQRLTGSQMVKPAPPNTAQFFDNSSFKISSYASIQSRKTHRMPNPKLRISALFFVHKNLNSLLLRGHTAHSLLTLLTTDGAAAFPLSYRRATCPSRRIPLSAQHIPSSDPTIASGDRIDHRPPKAYYGSNIMDQ